MSEPKDPVAVARHWLSSQGYELEYATARAFQEAGYATQLGQTYRDRVTEKNREIDVLAYPAFRSQVQVIVTAECKTTQQPWIVRKAMLDDDQLAWTPIASKRLAEHLVSPAASFRGQLRVSAPTGFDIVTASKGDNHAFAALSQLVDAARGVLASRVRRIAVLVYPVLVLDGPLLELWYDDNGRETLQPVSSERIIWSGSHHSAGAVAIDVWNRDHVLAGAESLRQSLGHIIDYLPPGRSFAPVSAAGV